MPFFFFLLSARVAMIEPKKSHRKSKPTIGRPFCFIYHRGHAVTYKLFSKMRS